MSNNIKISIKEYNFYYDDTQAVFDFNLDIYKHEVFSLFGPAGSGITTLLRSLNRLCDLIPGVRFEGEILLDGINIKASDINVTELRRKVGMVFDVPSPLPMSIYENIAYGPRMSGIRNRKSISEIVEQTLRMAALWDEVKDRLSLPAMSLSGGQQQRLCIARVLALSPEVILLDRPCAALDPISTAMIEDSLIKLKDQITIVIAPHNTQQVLRVSDRAAFMLSGKLIEAGSTEELFANPKEKSTRDYITGRFG